jgi:hypothetical protein
MNRIAFTLTLLLALPAAAAGSAVAGPQTGNGPAVADPQSEDVSLADPRTEHGSAVADPRTDDGFPGLSLRIRDEVGPAGSIVQVKVDVTEPKPISSGKGKVKVKGIVTVQGIALMNEDQDTYGVALVRGDELTFNITSPSSLFGTPNDYPILGIAGTVDRDASNGARFPLTIEASGLAFTGPAGTVYATEIQNGQLIVGNGVTIGDVSPGSSVVPAGGVVHITGTNFQPDTRLQFHEVNIAEQRFISSKQIDVVLASRTQMHGMRIRARNPDKSEATYFSYERTTPAGSSNDSVLKDVYPLFAPVEHTDAIVALPRPSSRRHRAAGPSRPVQSGKHVTGFALQNLNNSAATASIELLDANGNPYAVNTIPVGADRYLVREINEVFGSVTPPHAIRIRSTTPLQVLGLTADHSTGTAAALPPQ